MRQYYPQLFRYAWLLLILLSAVRVEAQFSGRKSDDAVARADTLLERQDFAGALAIYTSIIDASKMTTPQDFHLLYKRSYCYYSLGRFDDALADVNRYVEKTGDPQAKLLRAYVYQELGRSDDQLKDISELIAGNPGNAELLRWRASVLMDAGRYDDARSDVRKILDVDPGPDMRGLLGLTYYYDEKPDSALIIFDEVLASDPQHVQTYLYAASLALEQESYPLALSYISKGLQHEPANTTLLFYKGIALVEGDQLDEGCRCLSKAFSAGADDAGGYLKQYCYGVE